jgi:anion-transporting  ArsA/GET3 family ATPase
MSNALLLIERIVIESLSKKEKNIQEIEIDTNLSHGILLNILPNLLMRNMIRYKAGTYSIDKDHCFSWLSEVNKKENVKEEAKELFTSLVNQYFKKDQIEAKQSGPQLKIQKMWLTREEEMILKSHMATLEGFFQGVKVARLHHPQREKTCEQRVVIWGISHYSDLVEGVLKAV